jgi:CDP-diacylglycerol pyrophosphatase
MRPWGYIFAAVCLGLIAVVVFVAQNQHRQRDRLRVIVQEQCLPHWLALHQPEPCSSVTVLGGGPHPDGYAVLHDRKGGTHFLLIPMRTIRGIESPEALAPGSPNYFAAAWRSRDVLAASAGVPLPRTAIGMAVNQLHARSQDQLHIHMSCLRPELSGALREQSAALGPQWSELELAGHTYHALRIRGEDLASSNPVQLLADGVAGARGALADYTVLVAGAEFADGPGFIELASNDAPGAELLLDSRCAVVH